MRKEALLLFVLPIAALVSFMAVPAHSGGL
jgi:hypothetical protein